LSILVVKSIGAKHLLVFLNQCIGISLSYIYANDHYDWLRVVNYVSFVNVLPTWCTWDMWWSDWTLWAWYSWYDYEQKPTLRFCMIP